MSKKKVVIVIAPGQRQPENLAQANEFVDLVQVDNDADAAREIVDANALFVWDTLTRVIRDNALPPTLEWIHTGSIGVDAVMSEDVAASDVVVSHTRGVFEYPIAEYVLGLLIAITKGFRQTLADQAEEKWNQRPTPLFRGQTVVIVGPGAIGREIYTMLTAVGYNVIMVGRRDIENDETFGRVHSTDKLGEILPKADAVVLALPLTAQTKHLMNANRFAEMKQGATFINIGRGGLVDEDALVDALKSGRVGTAALDVFAVEPLPKGHPFWQMEQVIVSPHMSSDIHGWEEAVVDLFLTNMHHWLAGEPLENVVNKQKLANS